MSDGLTDRRSQNEVEDYIGRKLDELGIEFPPRPQNLKVFNEALAKVNEDRGAVYGHPFDDFDRAQALLAVVAECKEPTLRHALGMICVKIARLINTPTHLDSWIDIAGYARTAAMCLDRLEEDKTSDRSGVS
jgi:hypothetical protein